MKQKQSIPKLAALAVLAAACSDNLPDLPMPCDGYYNTETHSCYREMRPTCEGKDDCVSIGGENCEITSAEEKGHTYEIICEGEHAGYLDNGKPGEKGESGLDGTNGKDCSIANTESGVEITCGTLKLPFNHGIIGKDGEDGINGTPGENCKIAQTDKGVEITCGKVELQLNHGTNGIDGVDGTPGENCKIDEEAGIGVVITCGTVKLLRHGKDGDKGETGDKGDKGKDCTIAETDDGFEITCNGVEFFSLNHGKDGDPGSVITIDEDGYWCIDSIRVIPAIKAAGDRGEDCKVEDKGNRFEMFCGTKKNAEWPKTMPFFIDERDGKKYVYVTIGTQTWMAENLNYYTTTGSVCYDNDPANCDTYGRLYNWATVQTVCPKGWHLPDTTDWDELKDFIESDKDCSDCDSKHLRAESYWGNDSYGFKAFLGGYRWYDGYSDGDFSLVGIYGRWWTASEYSGNDNYALIRNMYPSREDVYWDYGDKNFFFSVRCVRDN